jgi:hypothetical protein
VQVGVTRLEIVQVGVTRLVALVKSPLLLERNASYGPSTDHALGEAIGWVVEMTTSNVGLSSVSVRPERNRVKVHSSAARGNQLDSQGTPVGLDSVAASSSQAGECMMGPIERGR